MNIGKTYRYRAYISRNSRFGVFWADVKIREVTHTRPVNHDGREQRKYHACRSSVLVNSSWSYLAAPLVTMPLDALDIRWPVLRLDNLK